MRPKEVDIQYYANDELNRTYEITLDGAPVDMSGDTLVMQIKRKKTDDAANAVAELSTANGKLTISGVNNNRYTMSGDYALDQDIYYYDVERTNIKSTTQYGKFIVTGDVTRT